MNMWSYFDFLGSLLMMNVWFCLDFLRKPIDVVSVGLLFNVFLYLLILICSSMAAHGHGLISYICIIHRVSTKFCFAINCKRTLLTGGYRLLYHCQFLSEGIVQAKWSQATKYRHLRNIAIKRFSDCEKLHLTKYNLPYKEK